MVKNPTTTSVTCWSAQSYSHNYQPTRSNVKQHQHQHEHQYGKQIDNVTLPTPVDLCHTGKQCIVHHSPSCNTCAEWRLTAHSVPVGWSPFSPPAEPRLPLCLRTRFGPTVGRFRWTDSLTRYVPRFLSTRLNTGLMPTHTSTSDVLLTVS